jgi:hypothetical protein
MRISTKRHQTLLSDAFPESSLALVTFLKRKNRRAQKVPEWRVQQIQNFVKALNATAFELERAYRERRRGTLAWSARNFLELSVWVEYCCTSEQNAKRFKDDTSRDMFGMVAAGKKANLTPERHRRMDQILHRLKKRFAVWAEKYGAFNPKATEALKLLAELAKITE